MDFFATPKLAALVERTKAVAEMDVRASDVILVANGQAPMVTFEDAPSRQKKFVEFYEAGKIATALCRGAVIPHDAKLLAGRCLAAGRTVTGFANVEEDFVDHTVWEAKLLPRGKHVMPGRIEDERVGNVRPRAPACWTARSTRTQRPRYEQ